jgi:hypothetical protein
MWAVLYGWTPEIFGTQGIPLLLICKDYVDKLRFQFEEPLAVLLLRSHACKFFQSQFSFSALINLSGDIEEA